MKPEKRIFFAVVRTAIGIGLLVYLGVSGAINWSALLGLAVAWRVTLAAILILFMDIVTTAWRLCVLLRPSGLHLSLFASVRLTLIGTFFNNCLPGSGGGDVIRIYYAMEGNRARRTELATIMLLDRAIGMFALVLMPLLAILLFPHLVGSMTILSGLLWATTAVAAGMLVALLVFASRRVRNSQFVSWTLRNLPLGSYVERVFDTLHAYRHNVGTLLATLGISFLAHAMTISVMLLLSMATNPSETKWEIAIMIPLGLLANALPLTPGGLGIGEAAFDTLFKLAGVAGGAEVMLGWRLLMLLVGPIGLIFYLQGRQRFIHDSPSWIATRSHQRGQTIR